LQPIRKVFCDTSYFYASLDRNDTDHAKAISCSKWMKENHIAALTTWEIIVETITLLRYRFNYQSAYVFVKNVLPELNVIYIGDTEKSQALELFLKLGKDKKLSMCDIISYLVVKKHFPDTPCIAFDRDFKRLDLIVL
jgi:predicted nucleic acid-binding protein